MKNTLAIALTCAAATLTGPAAAQSGDYHYVLPLNLAVEAASEAIKVCTQNGFRVTATVLDMDGVTQVELRGDGATVHTKESSYDKAYAVVTMGPIFSFDTSGAFFEMAKTNPFAPRLATVRSRPRYPANAPDAGSGNFPAKRRSAPPCDGGSRGRWRDHRWSRVRR